MHLKLIFPLILFANAVLASKNPNLVFIVVDDLRPNLGSFGYSSAKTPNIDALSLKSCIFTNAFAQQALCAPSRNSFLTSRRPDSTHLYDFYSYWRSSVGNFTTIPQHFKENGYHTYSIGKVFHEGESSNFTDDFPLSWSEKPFHPKTDIYKDAKVCRNADGTLHDNLLCAVDVKTQPEGTLPDLESTEEAIRFLETRKNTDEPFFLGLGYHKPHVPFKFPKKYLEYHPLNKVKLPGNRRRPPTLPDVAWNPWNDVRKRDDMAKLNISFPFGPMPDHTLRQIIQHYDAAFTYIDDLIGQVLSYVDYSNTVIIILGDHGWSLGEHAELAKFNNYQVATRAPLLIYAPGFKSKRIDKLVEFVDIFPTLVELTKVSNSLSTCDRKGLNLKLCTEGKSLVPLMVQSSLYAPFSDGFKTAIFTQYPRPGLFPTKKPDSDRPRLKDISIMGYTIITTMYRFTEWVHFNNTIFKPDWSIKYASELYDLSVDPNENINIAQRPEIKDITISLRKRLRIGWRYA